MQLHNSTHSQMYVSKILSDTIQSRGKQETSLQPFNLYTDKGLITEIEHTWYTLYKHLCGPEPLVFCPQRKGRFEQSISIHVQLTGALLFLHLSYLLSEWWVWHEADGAEGRVCLTFGLMLHWALLSTFTWLAIEGFHLYMLLVRVFNIYVRKYLLKLSLVGWGEITSSTHKSFFPSFDS